MRTLLSAKTCLNAAPRAGFVHIRQLPRPPRHRNLRLCASSSQALQPGVRRALAVSPHTPTDELAKAGSKVLLLGEGMQPVYFITTHFFKGFKALSCTHTCGGIGSTLLVAAVTGTRPARQQETSASAALPRGCTLASPSLQRASRLRKRCAVLSINALISALKWHI